MTCIPTALPVALFMRMERSKKLDFNLSEKVTELNEVIVTAERRNDNVTSTKMGVNEVNIQEIKSIILDLKNNPQKLQSLKKNVGQVAKPSVCQEISSVIC